ncbi:hypothetical protein AWN68_00290 [Roseivirga echinicomitans]|uniref:Peptidase M56 domain-containing protein n=2 Tax=Roseivirga echinicomitans TaxID=296218 RepID=A0A150XX60_9BACT|nr:hypothetical protein AWN68_00290 [Roseivirga echinicomitans]
MWNPILIWSLKAGLLLSLLYGVYFFLFRNNTQFHLKRVLLLSVLAAALLWPVIKFSASVKPVSNTQVFQKLDESLISPAAEVAPKTAQVGEVQMTETSKTTSALDIIWWVYLTGVAISLLVFFSELVKLTYWRLTGTEMRDLGKNVISHPSVKYPFSFWKWIFIPESVDYSESEWIVIQEHENLHLKQKHTVDILCAALAQCALWYHPAIYLFQKGMKSNHEALADSSVLKSTNFGRYTEILLALSLRTSSVTLGHSFALISSLSKRLKVMKLKKTSKRSSYTSLISFAVLALVIASQTVSYGQNEKANNNLYDTDLGVTIHKGRDYSLIPIFEKSLLQLDDLQLTSYGRISIPFILSDKYQEKVDKIKQTYYSNEEDRTFWIELDDNKDSYYSSLLKPKGIVGTEIEFVVELGNDDLKEFYELTVAWLKERKIGDPTQISNSKSVDFKIISEEDFFQHKYLSIHSYVKSNYERQYNKSDVFSTRQVDKSPEPIGGLNQFLNNVTLKTVRENGLDISELPKTIEFEFVVSNQGHVTRVDLLSKVKGDEETQVKVYRLLRQLNDNIQSVSRIYGWKPALKDNEFVSSKYKIEIPKSLL